MNTNTNNILKLVSSSGEETSLEISSDIFNDYLQDFKVKEVLNNKKSLIVLGNINTADSLIRGFDVNSNLNLYMSFDYLSGINISNNHLFVYYNTYKFKNLVGVKLELDYLGRIHSISPEDKDLTFNPNLFFESEDYISIPSNYYNDSTLSYTFDNVSDDTSYTDHVVIDTNSISSGLLNAEIYQKEFEISLIGEYISINFEEGNLNLLLVNKYNNYTYSYEIEKNKLIKVERTDDVSLYIEKNGKYYSLLATLEN